MIEGLIAFTGVAVTVWLVMREAYPTTTQPDEATAVIGGAEAPVEAPGPGAQEPVDQLEAFVAGALLFGAAAAGANGAVTQSAPGLPLPVASVPAPDGGTTLVAERRMPIAILEDLRLEEVLAAAAEDARPAKNPALRLLAAITTLALLAAGVIWVFVRGFVWLFDKVLNP
ncbi:MAG: hypothetical protein ABR548_11450 [Actinomycetota bacterium]|nr:hypothetical protein [Actinomycetota bacterium]